MPLSTDENMSTINNDDIDMSMTSNNDKKVSKQFTDTAALTWDQILLMEDENVKNETPEVLDNDTMKPMVQIKTLHISDEKHNVNNSFLYRFFAPSNLLKYFNNMAKKNNLGLHYHIENITSAPKISKEETKIMPPFKENETFKGPVNYYKTILNETQKMQNENVYDRAVDNSQEIDKYKPEQHEYHENTQLPLQGNIENIHRENKLNNMSAQEKLSFASNDMLKQNNRDELTPNASKSHALDNLETRNFDSSTDVNGVTTSRSQEDQTRNNPQVNYNEGTESTTESVNESENKRMLNESTAQTILSRLGERDNLETQNNMKDIHFQTESTLQDSDNVDENSTSKSENLNEEVSNNSTKVVNGTASFPGNAINNTRSNVRQQLEKAIKIDGYTDDQNKDFSPKIDVIRQSSHKFKISQRPEEVTPHTVATNSLMKHYPSHYSLSQLVPYSQSNFYQSMMPTPPSSSNNYVIHSQNTYLSPTYNPVSGQHFPQAMVPNAAYSMTGNQFGVPIPAEYNDPSEIIIHNPVSKYYVCNKIPTKDIANHPAVERRHQLIRERFGQNDDIT